MCSYTYVSDHLACVGLITLGGAAVVTGQGTCLLNQYGGQNSEIYGVVFTINICQYTKLSNNKLIYKVKYCYCKLLIQ